METPRVSGGCSGWRGRISSRLKDDISQKSSQRAYVGGDHGRRRVKEPQRLHRALAWKTKTETPKASSYILFTKGLSPENKPAPGLQ